MRKTRWSWYLLMSGIAVVSAEGLSWSTPVIFPVNPFVLLIYGLHYILIVDYLIGRRALTLRALVVGGFVVGTTTESLITKVIWNPPWDHGDVTRVLGLGLFEVGFIVVVWHAWMSMAVPFALGLTTFGYAEILAPRRVRRILKALPLLMLFGGATQSPALIPLVLVGIPLNALGIGLAARLHRRYTHRVPLYDLADVCLTRRERRIVWGVTILMYALLLPVRADALPAAGPLLLGMLLMVGSFALLIAVARADTGRMPLPPPVLPDTITYTARGFARYVIHFLPVSAGLIALALVTKPVSTGIMLVAVLLVTVRGDWYMLRLAWRVRGDKVLRRHAQRTRAEANV
jgi:hypothetical protein